MIRKFHFAYCVASSLILTFLISGTTPAAQTMVSGKQMREDTKGFQEFLGKVQDYIRVREGVEEYLRRVKKADIPANISTHQQELAKGIREARSHAHRGDIFQPHVSEAIRHAIRGVFQSAQGDPARATIEQGPQLKGVQLEINQVVPEEFPYTTLPPTLLLKLPPLPEALAYRIVGRDLILIDVPAGLVIDSMRKVIPLVSDAN